LKFEFSDSEDDDNILKQLKDGTAKFEIVSSPVASVVSRFNRNSSLFGVGNCTTHFFARIGSSLSVIFLQKNSIFINFTFIG